MESVKNNPSEEAVRPEVLALFNELIQSPEISEALNLLDSLPENLKYHNKNHTLDVIEETILFALADGLDKKNIKLQAIAAAWHDVGFTIRPQNNEEIAVEIFKSSKTIQSLSKSEGEEIVSEILDTQIILKDSKPLLLKQKSKFGYILDGDVSNFGRKDFFEKGEKIAEELGFDLSDNESKRKFYGFSLDLLKNHQWKTQSAIRLRQPQKEINIKELETEYAKLV